jgi:hypothetical protein
MVHLLPDLRRRVLALLSTEMPVTKSYDTRYLDPTKLQAFLETHFLPGEYAVQVSNTSPARSFQG